VSSIPRLAVVVNRWSNWRRVVTRDITIIRVRMMTVRAKLRAMSWLSHDCGMTDPYGAHLSEGCPAVSKLGDVVRVRGHDCVGCTQRLKPVG